MKTLLLALVIHLLGAASQQPPVCQSDNICGNPQLVDCTQNPTSCGTGQVLIENGSLCGCCNACYTIVGSGDSCRDNPAQGLYYQCPNGQPCPYNGYCT